MQRLDLFGLEATTIDWDAYREDAQAPLRARDLKQLRPHQQNALDDVMNGFEVHDRGKLIMALGFARHRLPPSHRAQGTRTAVLT